MTHTRHFKIPKYLKTVFLSTAAVVSLALLVTNVVLYSQQDLISSSKEQKEQIEDQYVDVSLKNANLQEVLNAHANELAVISEGLTKVEQRSGVSGTAGQSISERLDIISHYYTEKQINFDNLGNRIHEIEETMGIASKQGGSESEKELDEDVLASRIELASLNAAQEKILHDNIPNGYPTRNLGITSHFGKRKHPVTRQSSFHSGTDLRAKKPTNIYATADGVIKIANFEKYSGKRIIIQHNYGFETRYLHLSKINVEAGDVVQKGDLIGKTGNTGRSTSPHLHYEVRYLDKALNPRYFLEWEFGSHEIFTKVRGIQWHSLISLINKQITRPTLQLSQRAPELMVPSSLN